MIKYWRLYFSPIVWCIEGPDDDEEVVWSTYVVYPSGQGART